MCLGGVRKTIINILEDYEIIEMKTVKSHPSNHPVKNINNSKTTEYRHAYILQEGSRKYQYDTILNIYEGSLA